MTSSKRPLMSEVKIEIDVAEEVPVSWIKKEPVHMCEETVVEGSDHRTQTSETQAVSMGHPEVQVKTEEPEDQHDPASNPHPETRQGLHLLRAALTGSAVWATERDSKPQGIHSTGVAIKTEPGMDRSDEDLNNFGQTDSFFHQQREEDCLSAEAKAFPLMYQILTSNSILIPEQNHKRKAVWACDHCEATFPMRKDLKAHMREHAGQRQYKCEQCQAIFTMPSNLKAHMIQHEEKKETVCDKNEAPYPLLNLLKTQVKRKRLKQRSYKCDECGATFTQPHNLKLHRHIHTGLKPYLCDQCGEMFRHPFSLQLHMQNHTGQKPFTCNQCNATFKHSFGLKIHMQRHTGHKLYSCDQCEAAFTNSGSLRVHVRKHTGQRPYTCKECEATFARGGHLKIHMRKHTGQKPYACDKCNAAFRQSAHLTIHMRRHTGQKPYTCNICKASFTTSSNLNEHIKTHVMPKTIRFQ